jgi:hypothetical protein
LKSPEDVGRRLAGQWQRAATRVERLLSPNAWPLEVHLAKPPAALVGGGDWPAVRAHLDAWRAVHVGTVVWETVRYRATAEPVDVPVRWVLSSPSEWVAATGSSTIRDEHDALSRLVASAHPRYREFLIERRALVRRHDLDEVVLALQVAEELEQGAAAGAPLRALPVAGIDTKFLERNRHLLIALLDVRYDGAVSAVGLEGFLDAAGPDGHWLLVADLDGSLLPFARQRVTDVEIGTRGLPGRRIVVVENERCLHALPEVAGTVAVLGAGLNLGWLHAAALAHHSLAYWGDLDTWGLAMLAAARAARPDLAALLMDAPTFDAHRDRCVVERRPAEAPSAGLTPEEFALFDRLRADPRGRLEQEFLPRHLVAAAVSSWALAH